MVAIARQHVVRWRSELTGRYPNSVSVINGKIIRKLLLLFPSIGPNCNI